MEARSTAMHACEELSAPRVQLPGNNVEHQVVHTTDILFTTCSLSRVVLEFQILYLWHLPPRP
jgi:hypothetical protein